MKSHYRDARLLCPLGILILSQSLQAQTPQANSWPMYLRDAAHSSFNDQEKGLGRTTIAGLRAAWKFNAGAPLAAAVTVSKGVLYFGAWDGNFFAVRASDGVELWRRFVGTAPVPEYPGSFAGIGVTSQAAVAGDAVYVGGGDSAVYAFNSITGRQLWRLSLADPAGGSYLWSSITVHNNALYVGVASLDDNPLVPGQLVKIDLNAPRKPLVRFLSSEDEPGAGIWSTPALDTATNTVYVTTGTGEQDAENGLWGGTLMSLDATSLETKAYFFLPSNSLELDIEWGSSPTIFTTADGIALVAASGKDGVIYAQRQDDLSPVWATRLAVSCICPECGCGSLSTPAFDGKRLYAGAGVDDPDGYSSGSLHCLEPGTGFVLWKRSLEGTVIAPPAIANGLVFASTLLGLQVFNSETGETLWDDGNYGALYSQPVVVDGTVYSTYLNGDVVAWRGPR